MACLPFAGTRIMLLSTDNRTVDHHVFVAVISRQMSENPFDHTTFAPAAQLSVDVLPVSEPGGQIAPRNANMVTIQNGFHKQTIIRSSPTDMTFATRDRRRPILNHPTTTSAHCRISETCEKQIKRLSNFVLTKRQ